MKQAIAAILFIAFAAQTFDKAFIILDYYADKTAYAKNCENKDKPMMHCCGKCQLKKKLQQEENNDKQNPERRSENKNEVILSSKSFFATIQSPLFQEYKKEYPEFTVGKEIKMPYSVFHPPTA